MPDQEWALGDACVIRLSVLSSDGGEWEIDRVIAAFRMNRSPLLAFRVREQEGEHAVWEVGFQLSEEGRAVLELAPLWWKKKSGEAFSFSPPPFELVVGAPSFVPFSLYPPLPLATEKLSGVDDASREQILDDPERLKRVHQEIENALALHTLSWVHLFILLLLVGAFFGVKTFLGKENLDRIKEEDRN
jgi:hypothetical protein